MTVKTTVGQLRRLIGEGITSDVISEEYLHGVPEWQLRQDTTEYVDNIRDRIKRYILVNKSENPSDQREAISAMNDVCDELEEKLYDVLEGELYNFMRRV